MYREESSIRRAVCPSCGASLRGPDRGGEVTCPACSVACRLPERSDAAPFDAAPDNAPERLAELASQPRRERPLSPTLQAVLQGSSVAPGHAREAVVVWQTLCARAAQKDVGASEDLVALTGLLPSTDADAALAFAESACDAALLPRHRQHALGLVVCRAIAAGDVPAARRALARMDRAPEDIESDTQLRVSAASVAVVDGRPDQVFEWLGASGGAIPLHEALADVAVVLRAHAFEHGGQVDLGVQALHHLSAPSSLERARARFGQLVMCPTAAARYDEATRLAGAARAGSGGTGLVFGGAFVLGSLVFFVIAALLWGDDRFISLLFVPIGGLFLAIGLVAIHLTRASAKEQREMWLTGIPLSARVVEVSSPKYPYSPPGRVLRMGVHLTLDVAGPNGPYTARTVRLMAETEIGAWKGRAVRIRADPKNLERVLLEDDGG